MLRRWWLALVPLFVIASAAASARATTLTVNTMVDSASPGAGLCSLREAIQAVDLPGSTAGGCAPAAFGANTIVLAAGIYKLLAPNGELKVTPQVHLTIKGAGEATTVVNATGLSDRILEVQAGATVTISDLTLTDGHAANGGMGALGTGSTSGGPGGDGANGGGILNAGTLNLVDAAVTDSAAGTGGAGGNFLFGPGTPAANGGTGGQGGEGGAIFNTGSLTLSGTTIADNQAGDGGAGGPAGQGGGPAPSTGGTGGAGGSGGEGGGVANEGGQLQIVASTIRGNSGGTGASGGPGGGGWCCVSPSVGGPGGTGGSGSDGGGIWSDGGSLSVINSTIVSNTVGAGGPGGPGGSQVQAAAPGPGGAGGNGGSEGGVGLGPATSANLLNATVVDNTTGDAGAGGAAGQGTPVAATGANGRRATAGGIGGGAAATFTVQNSLLALNGGGNCGAGSILDGGHNLSFGDASCPSTFSSGDPKLGPLQNNGGPTQTIGLGPGSAAINQIPPAGAGCPATDQRGVPRPSGPGCEIGAYEVAPPMVKAGVIQATGRKAVRISAVITANAGRARVWVQYGRKKPYGKRSRIVKADGVTRTTVSVRLTALNLGAIYHYRIIIASVDGSARSAVLKLSVPILTGLHMLPVIFPEAGSPAAGTVLTYNEVRAATATFAVQRREGRRWVTIGRFRHRDVRGANRVHWAGRLAGRKVRPGRYRLLATPRAGSATGVTIRARFRIT